jgi:hypothetical protein
MFIGTSITTATQRFLCFVSFVVYSLLFHCFISFTPPIIKQFPPK